MIIDSSVELTTEKVKKTVVLLEKKFTINQELRVKYSSEPDKFLNSECELYDTIQECLPFGSETSFYPMLIKLNFFNTLFELLTHDNTDICLSVVEILSDLTDFEDYQENEEIIKSVIDILYNNDIIMAISQLLKRLDQKTDLDGITACFNIIDNLHEIDENFLTTISASNDFLQFLLEFLMNKNKSVLSHSEISVVLYSSELLVTFVQINDENKTRFVQSNGSEKVMSLLSKYIDQDPTDVEEREHVENLYDTLCACLLVPKLVQEFLTDENLKWILNVLKGKKKGCFGSLRILGFLASCDNFGTDFANKIVENLGLKLIFPLFTKSIKSKKSISSKQYDEYIISIIFALVKYCDGLYKQRVVHKFIENNYGKLDRLMELFSIYNQEIISFDKVKRHEYQENHENSIYELDPEVYIERLENGLYTLQLVSLTLLELLSLNIVDINDHVSKYFHQNSLQISRVLFIVKEYCQNFGDVDKTSNNNSEKDRVYKLMNDVQIF